MHRCHVSYMHVDMHVEADDTTQEKKKRRHVEVSCHTFEWVMTHLHTTQGWWNVEWDDKTKNQLLLAASNATVWYVPTHTHKSYTLTRALYIPRKSPVYSQKEPYIFRERALYILRRALYIPRKSPVFSEKEPCIFRERALYFPRKSPVYSEKEPCIFRERALYFPRKSPVFSQKEPCIFPERALYFPRKSPVYSEKEPCIFSERALYIPRKSPVYSEKEPCIFSERDLNVPRKSPVFSEKEPYIFEKEPYVWLSAKHQHLLAAKHQDLLAAKNQDLLAEDLLAASYATTRWKDYVIQPCLCYTAGAKASWNPACVEPIHWKPVDIDPGSLNLVKIGK